MLGDFPGLKLASVGEVAEAAASWPDYIGKAPLIDDKLRKLEASTSRVMLLLHTAVIASGRAH